MEKLIMSVKKGRKSVCAKWVDKVTVSHGRWLKTENGMNNGFGQCGQDRYAKHIVLVISELNRSQAVQIPRCTIGESGTSRRLYLPFVRICPSACEHSDEWYGCHRLRCHYLLASGRATEGQKMWSEKLDMRTDRKHYFHRTGKHLCPNLLRHCFDLI